MTCSSRLVGVSSVSMDTLFLTAVCVEKVLHNSMNRREHCGFTNKALSQFQIYRQTSLHQSRSSYKTAKQLFHYDIKIYAVNTPAVLLRSQNCQAQSFW